MSSHRDLPESETAGPSQLSEEVIEYTKDGSVSRMRAHKGNIPVLPQTKLCPLCPAKFTRTTHLNRHLRTHNNERVHICDTCSSQFTRSDLLTRHKRSCGDSIRANRSRRKSCQGCAESKIKCDQQEPCSKCQSRGRECIYLPRASVARAGSKAHKRGTGVLADTQGSPTQSSNPGLAPSQRFPEEGSQDSRLSPPHKDPSLGGPVVLPHAEHDSGRGPTTEGQLPILSSNPLSGAHRNADDGASILSSYASTSTAPSETHDDAEEVDGSGKRFNHVQEALAVQNHLNALFSNEMFDMFFNNVFTSDNDAPETETTNCIPMNTMNPVFGRTGVGINESNTDDPHAIAGIFAGQDSEFPFSTDVVEVQPFMAATDTDIESYFAMYASLMDPVPNPATIVIPSPPAPQPLVDTDVYDHSQPGMPSDSDSQHYLYLFLHQFNKHVPIVHVPTFTLEGKPPLLLSAMQACGAIYSKTQGAVKYINATLASARDDLVAAFARNPTDSEGQLNLILATVLVQMIGLFHQSLEQRAHSTIYHGMLVMMIRQSGLIPQVHDWSPSDFDLQTQSSCDAAWRKWAAHENAKRGLMISYLHDCCHSIYFNLRPTFIPGEFNLCLPCEDALWQAPTPEQWRLALLTPSPYGSTTERLMGSPIVHAYTRLATDGLSPEASVQPPSPLILSPFSHFIIIHAILKKMFVEFLDKDYPLRAHSTTIVTAAEPDGRERYHIQTMLHNWLHSWLHSPDTPRSSEQDQLIFFHDALPFYWIAQVSLLAYQEGLPPFAPPPGLPHSGSAMGEAKFRLVKEWLKHIRGFLRRGEQGPTLFWDELMLIRMKSWQASGSGDNGPDDPHGLLMFLAEGI